MLRSITFKKGPPPSINLDEELKNGKAIRNLIENNLVNSCHDVSSGGIILALLEMSISSNIGFKINTNKKGFDQIKYLFGEDQSRYIIEVTEENNNKVSEYLKKQDVSYETIGTTSAEITIDEVLKFNIDELNKLNKEWFHKYNN